MSPVALGVLGGVIVALAIVLTFLVLTGLRVRSGCPTCGRPIGVVRSYAECGHELPGVWSEKRNPRRQDL